MINRSTAQSLMADIWADGENDNELKKAYFGEHPLHDEAVDTLWGLNWFANGHPQDGFGNPLPLDRLAPDERRTAEDGLKAVYPLRTEIDKRQGVSLPWDRIAPEGAANINQARQKYLQTIDPVYSTALHERNHPAHESVKAHYGAWQDWQSGVPGPAPRWGDLDPINPYDRKAVSPLRNPWSAAALTDPNDRGLLGAGLAAGIRGAAAPAAPAAAAPSQADGGDAAPGPLSPSILKALSHLFAANVAGHLGIDPPRRLAPDDANDGMDDRSLIGGAQVPGFKTLEYVPGRDGKPNLTAEPYRPDRDGPAKFSHLGGEGGIGEARQQIAQLPERPKFSDKSKSPDDRTHVPPIRAIGADIQGGQKYLDQPGSDEEFIQRFNAADHETRLNVFAAAANKLPSERSFREKAAMIQFIASYKPDEEYLATVSPRMELAIERLATLPQLDQWRQDWAKMNPGERKAAIEKMAGIASSSLGIQVGVRFVDLPSDTFFSEHQASLVIPEIKNVRGRQQFASTPHIEIRMGVATGRGNGANRAFTSPDQAMGALLEEVIHAHQADLVRQLMQGELGPQHPAYKEARWLAANLSKYLTGDLYESQPFERGAKDWTKQLEDRLKK